MELKIMSRVQDKDKRDTIMSTESEEVFINMRPLKEELLDEDTRHSRESNDVHQIESEPKTKNIFEETLIKIGNGDSSMDFFDDDIKMEETIVKVEVIKEKKDSTPNVKDISKKNYISAAQKRALMEILKDKEKLQSGQFTKNFTRRDAQRTWADIANMLNAIPGSKKHWRQWRKTWQDLRSKAKGKKLFLKKFYSGTGPMKEVLTMINPEVIDGHVSDQESVVEYECDPLSSTNVAEMDTPNTNVIYHDIIIDHDYMKAVPGPSSPLYTVDMPLQKRNSASKRVNQTVLSNDKMVDLSERKLNMKERYYEKKLSFLERLCTAQERIATALENL